jgi:GT2 family glycosyltransferase
LTVAVATCGRPEALARCLDAIATQRRPPDQLIVVDQHPLVATRTIIAQSGLEVLYLEQPRVGLSASRNLALENSAGSIFAVTDDDCFPDPGWTEAIAAALTVDDLTAVTGPILPPEGAPPPGMTATSMRPSRHTRLFSGRVPPWAVGSGANFAARTVALRRIGGWDARLGVGTRGKAAEDCDILDRLLARGAIIRYDGRAVVHHAWQTAERRRATRWAYGFGIGAMAGMRLASRDSYGLRMLASYSKMHLRGMLADSRKAKWDFGCERIKALAALPAGVVYGARARGTTLGLSRVSDCEPGLIARFRPGRENGRR